MTFRIISLSLALLAATAPVASDAPAPLGRRIPALTLPDFRGRSHSLEDVADSQLVVVAFLGVDCPLARRYAPRLQELSSEFSGRSVAFLAIDSHEQDSLTEMAAFAQRYGLAFPFLKDLKQATADEFGVERTPTAYILDADRRVRYVGRIDDQFGLGSSSGYAKPTIGRRDLAEALEELLTGRGVSQPSTPVAGCRIGRRRAATGGGEATYTKHIAKLLDEKCVSCHRPGEIGPLSLTDYDDVVGWADMIREVVADGRMPPWSANPDVGEFRNEARLTEVEKRTLDSWIDSGCPRGEPSDLSPPITRTEGWRIATPDQVVRMREPIQIPAEGVVAYRYFYVNPGWKEDRWIQAVEVRPGNRAVVHHILVSIVSPLSHWNLPRGAGGPTQLTSYVPGGDPHAYEPGIAVYAPAGSQILFEIHYTPNGVPQEDQSGLALVFADPSSVRKRVYWDAAENREFAVPARAADHEVQSQFVFPEDRLLLSMSPHMHLRGKSFRFEARYPDGRRELLLDVPRYDFNWQIRYELASPKRMPAGTTLVCTGRFDNSENNPFNPDPDAPLRFGWQSADEMMAGFFISVSAEDDGPAAVGGKNEHKAR